VVWCDHRRDGDGEVTFDEFSHWWATFGSKGKGVFVEAEERLSQEMEQRAIISAPGDGGPPADSARLRRRRKLKAKMRQMQAFRWGMGYAAHAGAVPSATAPQEGGANHTATQRAALGPCPERTVHARPAVCGPAIRLLWERRQACSDAEHALARLRWSIQRITLDAADAEQVLLAS
jgi:hypothetical protein